MKIGVEDAVAMVVNCRFGWSWWQKYDKLNGLSAGPLKGFLKLELLLFLV